MKLKILMILSILLIGCSSKSPTPSVEYITLNTDVPAELLRCEELPSHKYLKNIRIVSGKKEAIIYAKSLILVNYKNCKKIEAIKEILS